jgi:hypothetical protein
VIFYLQVGSDLVFAVTLSMVHRFICYIRLLKVHVLSNHWCALPAHWLRDSELLRVTSIASSLVIHLL